MAQQDLAAAIPTAGADYDAVVKQLAALRTEMEKHAATVSQVPSNRGQVLTADVSGSMAEAGAISAGRPRTARRNSRVPWRRTLTSLSA